MTRPARQNRPFARSLLLAQAFAARLGGRYDDILSTLAACATGRGGSGTSHFAQALTSRAELALPRADLVTWDAAIGEHEARLARARDGFRLTHFQWLACLAVEWHLTGLKGGAASHVDAIEAYRAEHLSHLSPYATADAKKLACFMATGAGKTLVLHINLLQFLDHDLFNPQNILLLTPNEGLSAQHRRELEASGLDHLPLTVTEITKFYVDESSGRRPKKGVSEGTSRYEGPNLLLVDEGHKGGSSEAGTERQWRAIREALAAGGTRDKAGFTFEYSATFAQIADKDAALHDEYAKCVCVDFGYGRFYREGYGKEPRVLNARNAEGADRTLAAGLIHFYQQRRAFAEHRGLAADHQVEAPLLACVGKEVTASEEADVVELVRFLAQAASDTDWLAQHFSALPSWSRPAQGDFQGDPLDFSWLAGLGLEAKTLAQDMQARLFGGTGKVAARLVSDKEIGLACRGAAGDAYFGVIRVGEARKLLDLLEKHAGIVKGEPDRLAGSLFSRIDEDERLTVLLGAKMFVEGWSSWRVSALALMNVGRTPGAEIIQLFGRGVRLKGRAWSLKREPAPPPALALLQTLCVFGVRADYMQQYLETLAREGARPKVLYVDIALPDPPLATLGLKTLQPDDAPFREPLVFDPRRARAMVERIEPLILAAQGLGGAQTLGGPLVRIPVGRDWVAGESAFQRALSLKRRHRWSSLFVTPAALLSFLERCMVEAPADHFDDPALAPARRARVAAACIEKGLAAFMRAEERVFRMRRLEAVPLDDENAGLPWSIDGSEKKLRYRLEVDLAETAASTLLAEAERLVKAEVMPAEFWTDICQTVARHAGMGVLADKIETLLATGFDAKDDFAPPLPRLYVPLHLYQPLLLEQPMTEAGGQLNLFDKAGKPPPGLRISPPGLNEGEARFVWDLRAFWQEWREEAPWRDVQIFLLRNPANGGVTLFRQEGFAPDFLLWLRRGNAQVLAFIDPKGLGRIWPDDKIEMLKGLDTLALSLPVRGFLVTPSRRESLALPAGIDADDASLAREHIYLQEGNYIAPLLTEILGALQEKP